MMKGPVALLILDGWGHSERLEGNAVEGCRPANMKSLAAAYASTLLDSSGSAVGLPDGQFGNSEVGHTCMGAGRVVYQALSRVYRAITTGALEENSVIRNAMRAASGRGGALHLLGLVSDGGVHSHIDHLEALLRMAKRQGCPRVCVHAFMDGRDTRPAVGITYLRRLRGHFEELGIGTVASVSGRYYAMDRDKHWERIQRAYEAMTEGRGLTSGSAEEAMEAAYARNETDEFVQPTVIAAGSGEAASAPGLIRDGDSVIFFNFRADRAREMTRALALDDFDGFKRNRRPRLSAYVCLSQYDAEFPLDVAFPTDYPEQIFGEILAAAGWRQARVAETEKYAHVTFFFNGGQEKVFPGEQRILIPSPRVATYDLKPEMSAPAVTEAALRCLREEDGEKLALVLNFANADMVGHTGVYEAAVTACRTVDEGVGRIAREVIARGGAALITADHGNAEVMIDPETGGPHTAHTLNLVPLILAGEPFRGAGLRRDATLSDIAPTLLELMGLVQPAVMTGRSLLRTS